MFVVRFFRRSNMFFNKWEMREFFVITYLAFAKAKLTEQKKALEHKS